MTDKFDPKKYKDTYREELEEVIEKKLKGKPIRAKVPKRKATTNVVDITALLAKSLKSSGKKKTKVAASHSKKASKAKAA